jgi:hypothetical protein
MQEVDSYAIIIINNGKIAADKKTKSFNLYG